MAGRQDGNVGESDVDCDQLPPSSARRLAPICVQTILETGNREPGTVTYQSQKWGPPDRINVGRGEDGKEDGFVTGVVAG